MSEVEFIFEKELGLRRAWFRRLIIHLLLFVRVTITNASTEIVYVQDKLRECGTDIYSLLTSENGKLYVCGYVLSLRKKESALTAAYLRDAKGMAIGVRDALISIIKENCANADDKMASEMLASWAKEKRYLLDVWF